VAGTSIDITHNAPAIETALSELAAATDDLTPLMQEISVFLERRARERFDREEAPDGTPWAALEDSTLARKQRKRVPVNKILHGQSLHLRDTIFPFWSAVEAGISTGPGTERYAATHQFGDPARNIPARPFLGIGNQDRGDLLDLIEDEFQAILSAL